MLIQIRGEVDQVPQLLLGFCDTGTDSPLSDEVNELVAELANWEHWRILWKHKTNYEKLRFQSGFHLIQVDVLLLLISPLSCKLYDFLFGFGSV